MNFKYIFSAIIILVLITASFIFGYSLRNRPSYEKTPKQEELSIESKQEKFVKDWKKELNQSFLDELSGVIEFLGKDKVSVTSGGKNYVMWPDRPASYFDYLGIKNGDIVEARGKYSDNNRFEFIGMRKISK